MLHFSVKPIFCTSLQSFEFSHFFHWSPTVFCVQNRNTACAVWAWKSASRCTFAAESSDKFENFSRMKRYENKTHFTDFLKIKIYKLPFCVGLCHKKIKITLPLQYYLLFTFVFLFFYQSFIYFSMLKKIISIFLPPQKLVHRYLYPLL